MENTTAKNVDFLPSLKPLGAPFTAPLTRNRELLDRFLSVPRPQFWVSEGVKKENSLLISCYLRFWFSSPIYLPPFTFQSEIAGLRLEQGSTSRVCAPEGVQVGENHRPIKDLVI